MIFSLVGLVVTAVILLPELLPVLLPPRHKPDIPGRPRDSYTVCEQVGRVLCLVTPVLTGFKFGAAQINLWFWLMAGSIVLYYCVWFRYVFGDMRFELLYRPLGRLTAPLGVFSATSFLFLGLWVSSKPISVSALIYAIGRLENDRRLYAQCCAADGDPVTAAAEDGPAPL